METSTNITPVRGIKYFPVFCFVLIVASVDAAIKDNQVTTNTFLNGAVGTILTSLGAGAAPAWAAPAVADSTNVWTTNASYIFPRAPTNSIHIHRTLGNIIIGTNGIGTATSAEIFRAVSDTTMGDPSARTVTIEANTTGAGTYGGALLNVNASGDALLELYNHLGVGSGLVFDIRAASGVTPFAFNATVDHTSGSLLSVSNFDVGKFDIAHNGMIWSATNRFAFNGITNVWPLTNPPAGQLLTSAGGAGAQLYWSTAASQTPWTSIIDGAGFGFTNVGSGVVTNTLYVGASTNNAIQSSNVFQVDAPLAASKTALSVNTNGEVRAATNILVGSGSAARPAIGWIADDDGTGTGFRRPGANQISIMLDGVTLYEFASPNGNFTFLENAASLYFRSGNTVVKSDATAELQMGEDAASPIHQTLKSHDGSGTDKNGANLTLATGKATGSGRAPDLSLLTSLSTNTGAAANSYSERFRAVGMHVNLTESSATTFGSITNQTNSVLGAAITATVYAGDGAELQALTSTLNISAVNTNGTVVATLTQVDGTTAATSGTLTCTYTAVAAANSVDIKANAVSSLTQTSLRIKWGVTMLNADGIATVTPQ